MVLRTKKKLDGVGDPEKPRKSIKKEKPEISRKPEIETSKCCVVC